jgi:hypothetical protein
VKRRCSFPMTENIACNNRAIVALEYIVESTKVSRTSCELCLEPYKEAIKHQYPGVEIQAVNIRVLKTTEYKILEFSYIDDSNINRIAKLGWKIKSTTSHKDKFVVTFKRKIYER